MSECTCTLKVLEIKAQAIKYSNHNTKTARLPHAAADNPLLQLMVSHKTHSHGHTYYTHILHPIL